MEPVSAPCGNEKKERPCSGSLFFWMEAVVCDLSYADKMTVYSADFLFSRASGNTVDLG